MRILSYGAILAAMWCPLDAYAAGAERFIPDCAGAVAIARAKVARVKQDGTLILSDGRMLRLEGIRLPSAHDKTVYEQALAILRLEALGEPVNFTMTAPAKDRYGRLRVQGIGQAWLQTALLERGLARVQISPDRAECAPDLYEAESQARKQRLGIWASPDYRVRPAEGLKSITGSFQVIEGLVSHIGRADGKTFIDLGDHQFTAVIGSGDRRAFRDFDFDQLSARRVRVRGILQDYRGHSEMVLSNPYQIEMVD